MAYKVVKPFAYYADGLHGVELVVGDVRGDFGDSTGGLLAEKYIEELTAEVRPSAPEAEIEAEADGAQVDNGGNDSAGNTAGSEAPRTRRRLRG